MKHQEPTPPNTWLYKDIDEYERMFVVAVDLPDNAPLWGECTDEEKEQYECEHYPKEEPIEDENFIDNEVNTEYQNYEEVINNDDIVD